MVELELIAPQNTTRISFALEPAHNALTSLYLFNAQISGVGDWIAKTAPQLTEEENETNAQVCEAAFAYLGGVSWPTFPGWLDELETWGPKELTRRRLELIVRKAKIHGGNADIPTLVELQTDRQAYIRLMERIAEEKGKPFDREHYFGEYERLQNPVAERERIVDHLRMMWKRHLAREWKRILPTLQQSIAAFETLDLEGLSTAEAFSRITARDQIPEPWETSLSNVSEIIFIPSTHIGPYLLMVEADETTARIVTHARIPQGATISSPILSRSELLMRLSALSDDTRLHILELVAQRGELTTQDVTDTLDLSQSSASRHLNQLAATGYLVTRQHERTKYYRLNSDRIDQTFDELKQFVRNPSREE